MLEAEDDFVELVWWRLRHLALTGPDDRATYDYVCAGALDLAADLAAAEILLAIQDGVVSGTAELASLVARAAAHLDPEHDKSVHALLLALAETFPDASVLTPLPVVAPELHGLIQRSVVVPFPAWRAEVELSLFLRTTSEAATAKVVDRWVLPRILLPVTVVGIARHVGGAGWVSTLAVSHEARDPHPLAAMIAGLGLANRIGVQVVEQTARSLTVDLLATEHDLPIPSAGLLAGSATVVWT